MLLNKEKTRIDELDAMVSTRVNELSLLHTLSLSSGEGWANYSLQAKFCPLPVLYIKFYWNITILVGLLF